LLLLQFVHDDDLYVQRRAMIALAGIGSAKVEELVVPAWESGDEHQRMGVLYALWKVDSPLLDAYLAQAEADGRPFLTEYVARVRAGNPM
jgi:HEAT repeat protein